MRIDKLKIHSKYVQTNRKYLKTNIKYEQTYRKYLFKDKEKV